MPQPNPKRPVEVRRYAEGLCLRCGGARGSDPDNTNWCLDCLCRRATYTEWYRASSSVRAKDLARARVRRFPVKERVFAHYGQSCLCCGEAHRELLTIDHINQDGAAQRKEDPKQVDIYTWLVRHDFPPGFRVLCLNCNVMVYRYGSCPHANGV